MNPAEDKAETKVTELPAPPPDLSERAIETWWGYGNKLVRAGLLTGPGLENLRRYCELWDDYESLREEIDARGRALDCPDGIRRSNPAVEKKHAVTEEMLALEQRFGVFGERLLS